MTHTFSSKAQVLDNLYERLKHAKVLPLYRFTVIEYLQQKEKVISGLKSKFKGDLLIVRSSSSNEDNLNESKAGYYQSVLNIDGNKDEEVKRGIEQVISSYDIPDDKDEVFVQPMLKELKICGVAFTADLDTLSPYYIINYDENGQSDTVTGGIGGAFKTFIQVKDSPVASKYPEIAKIINALSELEQLFDNSRLDIEFAIDKNDKLYIFQVRPIATGNKEDLSSLNIKDALFKVYHKVEKLSREHPNLLGHRTVFGVMPDWNPAEIIGLKPKQLSISLYKELVTDNIWAYQRDNFGYRNLRSHPLMVSFMGVPFIDVRVDFNSFIPKKLDEKTAKKLVEFYLNKLIQTPSYHDKIEFEIVHSCFYFNLSERLKELQQNGFDKEEILQIEQTLLELTNKIIHSDTGLYSDDLRKIDKLNSKFNQIYNSELPVIDKIYWIIEDCKRYGTLPFAGIARASFIATQILRSIVEEEILTEEECNNYLNSFSTITRSLQYDLFLIGKGELTKNEFLNKYGHLRPGTYDILSLRYDENFENYFSIFPSEWKEIPVFNFTESQLNLIDKKLKHCGLNVSSDQLVTFIKSAIEGREYAKYVFTKSLSAILQLVEKLGEKVGISRQTMAYVDVKVIMNLYSVLDHRYLNDIIEQDIIKNREFYKYTKAIKLPSLIIDSEDVYGFYLLSEEPNFITLKTIQSHIVHESEMNKSDLEGKIIFIKSADPGYDFLFTKNIAGLITQFGGANSHMAVRCAEMSIPAVIGAGEVKFNEWREAILLEIDAANKTVKILL